jgi:hypothetical protein
MRRSRPNPTGGTGPGDLGRRTRPRRHRAALLAALPLALAALATAPSPAAGRGAQKHGWWNRANGGQLPFSFPAPPDVPAKGLYVAGTADDPQAISAVTYELPDGAMPGQLVLAVAGQASPQLKVVACPLAASSYGYEAAENGTWEKAPKADCNQAEVEGAPDEAGTSFTFAVAGLAGDGVVAIALLPRGTGRVAFEAPSADSLTVIEGAGGSSDDFEETPVYTVAGGTVTDTASTPTQAGVAASPSLGATVTDNPVAEAPAPAKTKTEAKSGSGDEPAEPDFDLTQQASNRGNGLAEQGGRVLTLLVLFGLLLYYAQGHGLLGARYDQ